MTNRELEDAVEDEAPAPRPTSVEAEYELVEVAGQVGVVHRPPVGAQEPALGQGRDPVHAREQLGRAAPRGDVALVAVETGGGGLVRVSSRQR